MFSMKMFKLISLLFISMVLASCGSSGGGNASDAATGRVSLLITDAPSDDFDQVKLTVGSISFLGGDNGRETIVFDESRVIDLLALQNYSDLLVTAVIPVGSYDKIRLHVSKVELVKYGQDPVYAKLASKKVDLNPRGSFDVTAGGHLMIELDIDAEKSIHIIENGKGYNFRPVVFVNIIGVSDDVKLVLLEDKQVTDRTESGFQLCEKSDDEVHADGDESGGDYSSCIAVRISEDTVVQDDLIDVTSADNVKDGTIITLLGRLNNGRVDALHIVLAAESKEVSNLALFSGEASSDFDVDYFIMDAGDGVSIQPVSALKVNLLDGSGVRVFDKYGDVVAAETIVMGTQVDVFGLADPGVENASRLKAAFVIVDNEENSDKLSGTVSAVNQLESQLTVTVMTETFSGDVCVDINDATIFVLAVVDGRVVTKEISIINVDVGMRIDAYVDGDVLSCAKADVVLLAEPLASTTSNVLLVTGY